MCIYFDPAVPRQCNEDDAEEVYAKEKVNFCEWFKPATDAFDPVRAGKVAQAKSELEALFGDGPVDETDVESDAAAVRDLFD